MGYVSTFLEAIRTRIAALESGAPAAKVFNQVWIAPFLDIERLIDATRIPAAVIIDNGSTLDQVNGIDEVRKFTVAVVHCVARDHIGEASIKALLDIGELLVNALTYDDEIAIYTAPDGELEAVGLDTEQLLLLVKTYQFEAEFERA